MCCPTCRTTKIISVRKIVRTQLWDFENRPKGDIARDMYGRPLGAFVPKPASAKFKMYGGKK